ncbi:hypothetical protein BC830DRAFT_1227596 [Chytriomyces sp. MP71]|nr:hypothetical protein BC830DRAFT_1227596 [Chytriomyces sp. MP71]
MSTATATATLAASNATPTPNGCSPIRLDLCAERAKQEQATSLAFVRSLINETLAEQCVAAFNHAQEFYQTPGASNGQFQTTYVWDDAMAINLGRTLQSMADCAAVYANKDNVWQVCPNPIGNQVFYGQPHWMSHEYYEFTSCVEVYKYWVVDEAIKEPGANTNSNRTQDDFKTIVGFSNSYSRLACAAVTKPAIVFACAYATSDGFHFEFPWDDTSHSGALSSTTIAGIILGVIVTTMFLGWLLLRLGCLNCLRGHPREMESKDEETVGTRGTTIARPFSLQSSLDMRTLSSPEDRKRDESTFMNVYATTSSVRASSTPVDSKYNAKKRAAPVASYSSSTQALAHFGHALLPRDPLLWTVDQVTVWMHRNDVASASVIATVRGDKNTIPNHSVAATYPSLPMTEQKVNGIALLHLNPSEYECGLEIKTLGERVAFEVAVNGLRAERDGVDVAGLAPPEYEGVPEYVRTVEEPVFQDPDVGVGAPSRIEAVTELEAQAGLEAADKPVVETGMEAGTEVDPVHAVEGVTADISGLR